MTAVDISGALEIIDYIHRAKNLTQDQKTQILNLQRVLSDTHRIEIDLLEENRSLKEEVRQLKDTKSLEERVKRYREGVYITFEDDNQNLKFCSACWDDKKKAIQMVQEIDFFHGDGCISGISYKCPICKSETQPDY